MLAGFLERALFLGLQMATFLLYPYMVKGRRREAEEGERRKGDRERERESHSVFSYKGTNTIVRTLPC